MLSPAGFLMGKGGRPGGALVVTSAVMVRVMAVTKAHCRHRRSPEPAAMHPATLFVQYRYTKALLFQHLFCVVGRERG